MREIWAARFGRWRARNERDGRCGGHGWADAGRIAVAAGLVARHGEHGDSHRATMAEMSCFPVMARAAIRRRLRW